MVGEGGSLQWRRGNDPQIPGGKGSCWPRVGAQLVEKLQKGLLHF